MLKPEYMKVPLKYFPQDTHEKYKLQDLVHSDGHVYIHINTCMHGLKKAAILAYKQLADRLTAAGYYYVQIITDI